jgi:hypothetical protein
MTALQEIAPAFVEMAHRIVWCVVGTASADGDVRTRVLHPIWQWDGTDLTGWIATGPDSPKAAHLAANARVSLTYWAADQDTCTADCTTTWDDTPELRRAGWDRFRSAPAPVGFDPAVIPGWTSPDAAAFGVLRLHPLRLRLMDGSMLITGSGRLLTWRND